jgi:2,3-diaminopropionate biosynthesis protein SbnB
MLYINKAILSGLGIRWEEQREVIYGALRTMRAGDAVQPVKPYLRYRDTTNRIIAMPAFVGGETSMAGIKWIASFPGNAGKGLKRAHSITVLNEADTGIPLCVFNTALISGIRTAAVSAVVLDAWLRQRPEGSGLRVGIAGFGPIGQLHLQMVADIARAYRPDIRLYDVRTIDQSTIPDAIGGMVTITDSWKEAYSNADVFITCTVSSKAYVDLPPKPGSLQMNISLRDYVPDYRKWVRLMIVDDWEEVCRENTDIENMYRAGLLRHEDTATLAETILDGMMCGLAPDDVVMFNPMGMAVFDIAVAAYYYRAAMREHKGLLLEE